MASGQIERPEHLPAELVDIWEEMLPQVSRRIGAAGLEALCMQVSRMRDAHRRIETEGMVVQDPKGNPAPHPALAVEKQAQGEVRQWLVKFGGR
jgi:P27 family predicted phage terminase small subunit